MTSQRRPAEVDLGRVPLYPASWLSCACREDRERGPGLSFPVIHLHPPQLHRLQPTEPFCKGHGGPETSPRATLGQAQDPWLSAECPQLPGPAGPPQGCWWLVLSALGTAQGRLWAVCAPLPSRPGQNPVNNRLPIDRRSPGPGPIDGRRQLGRRVIKYQVLGRGRPAWDLIPSPPPQGSVTDESEGRQMRRRPVREVGGGAQHGCAPAGLRVPGSTHSPYSPGSPLSGFVPGDPKCPPL